MSAAVVIDRNRTIWQRIQDQCQPVFGRETADQMASLLLPLVKAERQDALERFSALVPLHVLRKISIMGFNDRCCTNLTALNDGAASMGCFKHQCSVGDAHVSPSSCGAVGARVDSLGVTLGQSA